MKKYGKTKILIYLCYFGLYLVLGLSLLVIQPFGDPPDEYNRYLIPQYIAEHGTLPNGYEESILIEGYGFSYAFQPILPYMLQGYAMRFVRLFTDSQEALLYTARGVNLFLGLLTAWFVLLLSGKWFRDRRSGLLFAFLATFLPQSLFIHTYVNTDSCCMLSAAIMLYGLTLGLKSGFSNRSAYIMALGIILCALSYYNAYGYILSCILLFTLFYFTSSGGRIHFDCRTFFKKGCLISGIVLSGIAWWFIRSAILYEGDFLGLATRDRCAALHALPEHHPDTRITWQNQGFSLWEMLRDSDFISLSVLSFIGIFGSMTIVTSIWVYRFYKALFFFGLVLSAVIPLSAAARREENASGRRVLRIFYHVNMVFCILMPVFLSMYYSYTTDYQPQGRYLLPALLPLCYYTVRGLEKVCLPDRIPAFMGRYRNHILTWCTVILCAIIAGMAALTIYGYVLPYYSSIPGSI